MSRLKTVAAAGLIALLVPACAAAATRAPDQVVEDHQAVLLSIMKNARTLGFKGRFERLRPTLEESFDLPYMARVTVGRFWAEMSDEQRTRFVRAFSDYSVANFAHRFDDYSGEHFEIVKQRETRRKDILVFTDLVKSDGDKVEINYLLRNVDGRWQVIDVFLDRAFSEIATRRSEYTSVIRHKGIEQLIVAIKAKTREMAVE